ncbi:MAG: UvrD-helicase domain-containing protein [Parcubacteria group bacterium]
MDRKEAILKDLNKEQIKAVQTITGPVLILAGAGSGKTRALTHRIAYMIEDGISPHNILAVTFTNRAAKEMKERINKLLSGKDKSVMPVIGTFHSVCLRILRAQAQHLGYDPGFVIYDTDDQVSVVKNILENLGIDQKRFKPQTMLNKISTLKNELITSAKFEPEANSYTQKLLQTIYEAYQDTLKKMNAMDFDDLIMNCVQLFQTNPEILEKYQDMFNYILIDEYQDTNHAQYVWVKLLARKHRNVAVVGDDNQSIYGWRQADIRNILDFEKDYPEAVVISLEQNYRSTQTILDAANNVISNNKMQKLKNLWTDNSKGEAVIIKEAMDHHQEAKYIVEMIQGKPEILKHGAILYRTHAQSRNLEEALVRHGIPYSIFGGIKFYERREVKDVLAYLRLTLNPRDQVSFGRIYNVPTRGLGATTYKKLLSMDLPLDELLSSNLLDKEFNKKQIEKLHALDELLQKIGSQAKTMPASKLVLSLLKLLDYKRYIDDGTPEGEVRWDNVKEIITAAQKYDEIEPPRGLEAFLEEVALLQDTDTKRGHETGIRMMTLHSAKGLEFDTVFMVGMEEGIFPHARSLYDVDELEEERRLCYVGITRAERELHMIYCRHRNLYGSYQMNPPSRFILEVPEELIEFKHIDDEDYVVKY